MKRPKHRIHKAYLQYSNAQWRRRLPLAWRVAVDIAVLVVVGYLAFWLAMLALELLILLLLPVMMLMALAGGGRSGSDDQRWMEDNDPRGYEHTHAADQVHFD